MTQPKYKVTYVSNSCGNTDELSNQPHESVAQSLYDLLINHTEITHPVIGVEGSWGSGKSQVINILQRIIKEKDKTDKFCFITYDIWSSQEDLTRRSFLDSILSNTKNNNRDFETKILEEDYAKLNATSIIRKTRTFPSIRFFFATLLLIPITSFIINSIEHCIGYNNNALWTYDQLKGCLNLILSLFSLIVFIISYKQELAIINSDSNKKNFGACKKFMCIVGRMLYVFKEKDIEKEDYETIITDEPSVSRFQHTFDNVYKSLKAGKTLIIVFDNMDRLSNLSKLMSSWSLLHTFFAERNYEGKIWAIVPYAKQQLIELMKSEGNNDCDKTSEFINKTFFTTFRIPEPIMGSWKYFLNSKLNYAFNPAIDDEDKTVVALIFSRSMVDRLIRPRDIIVYVNKLVTLYSQHYFEEIPIAALALYAQYEDKFTQPLDAILKFKGFESLVPLFEDSNQLSGWLSSIYYNLPSNEAIEIAYERSINAFLQTDYEIMDGKDEKESAYKDLSSNKAFKHHIEEYFNVETDYTHLKMENLFYLLGKIDISSFTRQKIYRNIANQIQMLKDQFSIYEPWMEYGFLNCDEKSTNTIIDTLLIESKHNFESYYTTVIELIKIKEKRKSLRVPIGSFVTESVQDMVNLVKYLKEENAEKYYTRTKISIEISKLLEFMQSGATTGELFSSNTDSIYDLLRVFRAHGVDLSIIADAIIGANVTISNLSIDKVERIYKVFNIVNTQNKLIPSYTQANSATAKYMIIPEYLACAINKLISTNASTQTINAALTNEFGEETKAICKYITKYASTDDLFKLAVESKNKLLIRLIQVLIADYTKTLISSGYLLEHTTEIINVVLTPCEDRLITLLDNNAENILTTYGLDCLGVDTYWTEKINKKAVEEHTFFRKMSEKWIEGFRRFSKDDWCSVLQNKDTDLTKYIHKLEDEELLPVDLWYNTDIENAIKESFLGYINNENQIDESLFELWKKHVGETMKATLVNYVVDSIQNPSQINIIQLVKLIHLYVGNSKRLNENKYANSFYDEYFNRFIKETPISSLLQFTIDNWAKLHKYALLLSNDRIDRLITVMDQRKKEIPVEAQGLPKWEEYIKILQSLSIKENTIVA